MDGRRVPLDRWGDDRSGAERGGATTPTPGASGAESMGPRLETRSSTTDRTSREMALLRRTLAYAREREYTGPDYGDGMSSRLLRALPVESKWLNLAVQETVKRSPVNLRPLFLVEQRRNFKGAALFAMANVTAHRLSGRPGYLEEAESLVEWLLDHQSDWYPEFCGCHRHDLQGLDGRVEAGTPGVVGTAYGVQALLAAADAIDDRYADVAHSAAEFVLDRLDYEEGDLGARIKYKPTESGEHYTLNANALGARILLDLHADRPERGLRGPATEILDYVVSRQTDAGGWYYRHPPDASHLSMDTHHNGFITESLLRFREVTGSDRYQESLSASLSFHREVLFDGDGAPNFDESSTYPRDVHAAAQGVLVFTYAGDLQTARKIIDWTVDALHAGDGRFYFRKHRLFTNRVTLMRWCQAWMAYALAEYLIAAVVAD